MAITSISSPLTDDLVSTGDDDSPISQLIASLGTLVSELNDGSQNVLTSTQRTFTMTDDDNAATTGTAVLVAPTWDGPYIRLWSVNAGTEDSTAEDAANAEEIVVFYDANPATNQGAVQLYFDEDATAGARLLAVLDMGDQVTEAYAMTQAGRILTVTHDASAATNGKAVYFDDDGASAEARLLFVSDTDASGSEVTSATVAGLYKVSG